MSKNDLEKWWDALQKKLKEKEFKIFPAIPPDNENVSNAYWIMEDDVDGFVDLAKALDINLLYVQKNVFSESDLNNLEQRLYGDDDSDDDSNVEIELPKEAKLLSKQGETHLGQVSIALIAWKYDNILHYFSKQAEWYTEIKEKYSEQVSIIKNLRETEKTKRKSEMEEEANKIANKLAGDKNFYQARTQLEQRRYIEKIYPNIDEGILYNAIQTALEIYQSQILPSLEKEWADKARKEIRAGKSKTTVATNLGITVPKLNRLLATYTEE